MSVTYAGGAIAQPLTRIVIGTTSTTSGWLCDGVATGHRIGIAWSTTVALFTGTAFINSTIGTGAHMFVGIANGASSIIRVDGAQKATGSTGTNDAQGMTVCNRFDGTGGITGSICEVVEVTGTWTTADIVQSELYFRKKYGTW